MVEQIRKDMAFSLVYNPKPRMELINNYIIPYLERI